MEVKEIPIKNIIVKENYRNNIEETHLDEMMQSIKQHGLKSAIDVRPLGKNRYELISGNRRLQACVKLGYSTINAQISQGVDDKKLTILNLTENIQRKDPTFSELGRGIEKLMTKDKMDLPQIAARLGISAKEIKTIIDTYRAMPVKHRHKVKFMSKGTQDRKGGIPHTVASHLAMIRKTLSMPSDQFDQLIDYVIKNNIPKDSITNLMHMMSNGLDINDAFEKLKEYHVYNFNIIAPITLIQRLMQEHNCTTTGMLFRKIIYDMAPGIPKPDFIKLKD